MSKTINLYFDYRGSYSKSGVDEIWNSVGHIYGLPFKTCIEEISYSALKSRICKKIGLDEATVKVQMSFIPLVCKPQRSSLIFDDDDVYNYLTSMDEEHCRSVLHVEVIEDMVIDKGGEQLSRVGRGSSFGVNYEEELHSTDDVVNTGAITVYIGNGEPVEQKDPLEQDLLDVEDNSVENDFGNDEYVEPTGVTQDSQFIEAWEDGLDIEVGQEFGSKQVVQELVDKAAFQNCFVFGVAKSDRKLLVLKCRQEGCKWHLRVAKVNNSDCFSVRVYRKMHTCSRATASTSINKRKGTRGLVASVLHDDYPGQFATPTPKSLITLVQGRLGVTVSYSTALRGKKQAIRDVRGNCEESYEELYSYMYMLEKVNPGTKTSVVVDEAKKFKYLFVALGASIEGFQAMRKVIVVDATFLKTVYKGVLIFATAQDPNHHHYPIAFGVLDGEKDASWNWFFSMLKTVIPDSPELVFVSDRNSSLIKAIREVYPIAQHGYCLMHLSQNVRTKVSNVNKDIVSARFKACGQIYTVAEFHRVYADYCRRYPSVAQYLYESCEVEKWARCYFPGERYNIDTSNIGESMNNVFRNARKYPLLPLIDTIIEKIGEWFNKHRIDSQSGSSVHKLVPIVDNLIHSRCENAAKLTVIELNTYELEYRVNGADGKSYVVNLLWKRCTCRCFDIDKYPCEHAIAAVTKFMKRKDRDRDIQFHDLCSPYYLMEQWAMAYCRTIYPVPAKSDWTIPDEIKNLQILPPSYTKKKGRNKEKRYPSVGERRPKPSNKRVSGVNMASWFDPVQSTEP